LNARSLCAQSPAYQPETSQQLGRTDAVAIGAALPRALTTVGDRLFFVANSGPGSDTFLWSSDGSAAGTNAIAALPDEAQLAHVGDQLYLRTGPPIGGGQLWTLDENNSLVRVSGTSNVISRLTVVGDQLFFKSHDSLCRLGTSGEVCLARTIYQQQETPAEDLLFFIGLRPDQALGFPLMLWVSDSTPLGTHAIDITPAEVLYTIPERGPSANLVALGRTVFFAATDPMHGVALWKSDGTPAGTSIVSVPPTEGAEPPGAAIDGLAIAKGQVFFSFVGGGLVQLWASDGTAEGTHLVKDFGEDGGIGLAGSWCRTGGCLSTTNDQLFFTAYDAEHGWEPWASDGSEAGTRRIADVNPGTRSSNSQALTDIDGRVVFRACNDETGCEIWISDGTSAGTCMSEIAVGAASADPEECAALGALLLCSADDGIRGRELWAIPSTIGRACVGDCDGDGRVAVDELVTGVGMALGTRPLSACPEIDKDANDTVSVDELVSAVRSALEGCG
jgi:ELWxxDGT repeat protein